MREAPKIKNESSRRRQRAADRYRPAKTRVLFVAETPPSDPNRYFYFPDVPGHDALWVELMKALYPDEFGSTPLERKRKGRWLERFQQDGYQLIDALEEPVTGSHSSRVEEITRQADACVSKVREIKPDRILLIKKSVYDGLAETFRRAKLPLINEGPIPFPGSGQQQKFQKAMKCLIRRGKL